MGSWIYKADLAAEAALSFPLTPMWLGVQHIIITGSIKDIIFKMTIFLKFKINTCKNFTKLRSYT